ncbi:MAG: hypothetical protein COA41_19600 [Sphingopyxis sp.]|nr:MAG: hypothetical protein COA41_19600 [Sphingopyxis sp.]|tara:strand:- start:11966 stop:12619 length:654 start_codon:yes stop_codon:yes gene_type:complete
MHFESGHEDFRKMVNRSFLDECLPHHEGWETQGYVEHSMWKRAGELGLLCMALPQEYGGLGADARFTQVLMEEQGYTGFYGMNFQANDIVASYIYHFGTEAQRKIWLSKIATGAVLGALGMTEQGGGSDLQAIKTKAVKNGDDYIVNGSKIFISNGYMSDLIGLVVKTGRGGARDISILLVEADPPGLTKGKPLKKMGMKAQDTSELFFEDRFMAWG